MKLDLQFGRTIYEFVQAAATGRAREIACFGTRGDGKTIGALMAMLAHAQIHESQGFPLPCKWIGVADTFESHKLKTCESLRKPFWNGLWQESDGGRMWKAGNLIELSLFGVKDNSEIDRVRTECVGVWFEEPAPVAVLVQSSGLTATAWTTALTSQRIPSHCHPAIMTLNYPDEDHWTWERFVTNRHPGTMYFRIPPGERATAEDRAEWERILADRPDLARRLLRGEPGTLQLGPQVALGFREDLHVVESIKPIRGEPILIGQDGGHTPTTIIGQQWRGYLRVYAALTIDRGGMRQLYEQWVMPWFRSHAPEAIKSEMIQGIYDPATPDDESDIDRNPIDVCREMLGGWWESGPVAWEARKGALITSLNRHVKPGQLALQIDRQGAQGLIRALSGRWYYPQNRLGQVSRDKPAKPNHPWEDLGDAFCYWICAAMPELTRTKLRGQDRTFTQFDARFENDPRFGDNSVESDFDPRLH